MDANVITTFERARRAAALGHTEREVAPVEVPAGRKGGKSERKGGGAWGHSRACWVLFACRLFRAQCRRRPSKHPLQPVP